MGRERSFCLLYDETVNFGSKSRAHQGFGMLMGMLVGFQGWGQRSLDLRSVLFELFDQTEKQVSLCVYTSLELFLTVGV